MSDDPYALLGVARDATDKQIRSAYLKLAKSSHPDLHPGDAKAEERFKAISAANDLLSDPERRGRFDRGEIDGSGHERPPPGPRYRDHAERAGGTHYRGGFGEDDDDLGDILSGMFRQGRATRQGANRRYTLTVGFLDAVRGGTKRLDLPDGGTLDVRIPAGIESGQVLRLRGKGGAGEPAGDALIEIEVAPHALFRREGNDIHLDLPVSVAEAVLGGRVVVPTITGAVTMTLPAGSDTGTMLRLRGKGVASTPPGDAYARVRIMLGPKDAGLADFLRDRTDAPEWNPRAGLEDGT
jgi:DnaJ-class molecular chaperone